MCLPPKANPTEQGLKLFEQIKERGINISSQGKSNRTRIETYVILKKKLNITIPPKANPTEQGLKQAIRK